MPRDIARAALYLASDASAFVSGTHLVMDGSVRDAVMINPIERLRFWPQSL